MNTINPKENVPPLPASRPGRRRAASSRPEAVLENGEPNLANVHPGEILAEEFMEPLSISGYQLARETGMTEAHVSQIIRGRRSITPETALRLGAYFGTTAQFWMNLQTTYGIREAKASIGAALQNITIHPRALSSGEAGVYP